MTISSDDAVAHDGRKISELQRLFPDMEWIVGGSYMMGSNDHYPEEAPAHRVAVNAFLIDRYAVTNADFARFAAATGYVTLAERAPAPKTIPARDRSC